MVADGRVLRWVSHRYLREFEAFATSSVVRRFIETGKIISCREADFPEAYKLAAKYGLTDSVGFTQEDTIVEHEPVSFPSFAYEWPPEMLEAAGLLTLDLAENLLADGLGLKDATPYNVLFRGTEPVFTDVLSIEPRDAHDPLWVPYAQFIRTFLLPLALNKRFQS